MDGRISLHKYENKISIVFENNVKPSVIQSLCKAKTYFDVNSIIASTCYCKSGCKVDPSLINKYEKTYEHMVYL